MMEEIKRKAGRPKKNPIETKDKKEEKVVSKDKKKEVKKNLKEIVEKEHDKKEIKEKPEKLIELTLDSEISIINDDNIPEENKEEVKLKTYNDLSYHAKKWYDYLKYQNVKPEKFLAKYPNHKFKVFVEELLGLDEKHKL